MCVMSVYVCVCVEGVMCVMSVHEFTWWSD